MSFVCKYYEVCKQDRPETGHAKDKRRDNTVPGTVSSLFVVHEILHEIFKYYWIRFYMNDCLQKSFDGVFKRHLLTESEFVFSFSPSFHKVKVKQYIYIFFAVNLKIILSNLNKKQLFMLHVCSVFVLVVIKMLWLPFNSNATDIFGLKYSKYTSNKWA